MAIEHGSNNDPASLITKLQQLATRLSNNDHEAKKDCLQLSKALTAQLEPPENIAVDMAYTPMIAATVRIAIDLNLFEHIVQYSPVPATRLAALSGAEEPLVFRILRLLSAVHFVEETAPRTWKATPITEAMATKGIPAGHRMISEALVPAIQRAPAFFAQRGYTCPIDPSNGLLQAAFKTDQTTFEYIASNPSLHKDFNMFMGNATGTRRSWLDWYPVQSRILDGADPDRPLLVDVGGGKGHDLVAFNERFPGKGKLVLQDMSAVIGGVGELDNAIETAAYDFFAEQPLTGARVYFYHHILHDWSDRYCVEILKRVAAAMTPGYSKLLVHEMIVPELGASRFEAQMDISMMVFNGGMERTGGEWRALLGLAGLKVVEVWEPVDEGGDGIIEAVRI
ncbi:o-methyltransferase [Aspergillus aurantiobrunneus]